MRSTLLAFALFFLSLGLAGARRGGSSGDDGGDGEGSEDEGSGGSGGTDAVPYVTCNPADFDDLYDPNTVGCGLGTCGCNRLLERRRLYGLPGLYYNGAITIRHELSSNTAWAIGCNNDDEETKIYRSSPSRANMQLV